MNNKITGIHTQLEGMRFERISKYAEDEGVIIPTRKTRGSAGYDFCAAEDIVILPYESQLNSMTDTLAKDIVAYCAENDIEYDDGFQRYADENFPYDLSQIAALTKLANAKPTLVPTGIKCQMPEGVYLQLQPRSSLPLKHWLVMANGVGK